MTRRDESEVEIDARRKGETDLPGNGHQFGKYEIGVERARSRVRVRAKVFIGGSSRRTCVRDVSLGHDGGWLEGNKES